VIEDTGLLEELRPYAFSIAYRMLGSVAEAEDVVQEALLRVHGAIEAGTRLESPRAYVATVTTRLALDQLKSARVRREQYVGEWLPEPLITDEAADPARHAEIADAVSYAFLALLERLSPEQRAALLLRDVFDYGYPEIAGIIGTSPENARQLASRARRHVTERRPRFDASPDAKRALATGFFAAVERGDLDSLEKMLARDVVLHGDGGGKVPAIPRALEGRDHAIRTLAAWWRAGMAGRAVARIAEVNGEPGAVLRDRNGGLLGVIALEIAGDQIVAIRSVVNPDKLQHLGPLGDMHEVLAQRA
jgi:RNA polymerase sigma-70 factor (TIGR02957 family)